jgi:hypothetical protein
MSSLLSMLQTTVNPLYEKKYTPEEKGALGGGVLKARKLARQRAQREELVKLLKEHRSYPYIAKKLGVSSCCIWNDVQADPELKKLASLYIKVGGWRGGKRKSIAIRKGK